MEQQIKELRIKIDGLAQLTKELKPIYVPGRRIEADSSIERSLENSKEIKQAVDSLLLAKAWLGKMLQELNVPTPYKSDGHRHSVKDIEPTADTKELNLNNLEYSFKNTNWTIMNHIEKVDWLRQEIQKTIIHCVIIVDIKNIPEDITIEQYLNLPDNLLKSYYLRKCKDYLIEARFWLGFELQRIKES